MNHFWGILGLLLMLLVLAWMVLIAGKRLRAAKTLLARLHYDVPESLDLMTKQADALLFKGRNMSLDLRVADVPSDVNFKVYLSDILASFQLPYDVIPEPECASFSDWRALSQQSELPYLYVLYRQMDAEWVYLLLATDKEHYENGIMIARKFAHSISLADG